MPQVNEIVSGKKAAIFDLFHTLTAVESSWGKGLPTTHEMLGFSPEVWDEQIRLHSRARLTGEQRDPFRIVADMAWAIDPAIAEETIRAAVVNRVKVFEAALLDIPEETITVLRTLKSRGKRLGLISDADAVESGAWSRSPAAPFFDAVAISCCVGTVKPERRIYDICLGRLGVRPDEAVYVGDGGSSELQGAKALGMTAVMVTGVIRQLWPDRIEQRAVHADFVVERLTELL